MRQRRWMEYLENYDFTLHYHLGKANVVADALSRKSRGVLASITSQEWQMIETVGQFRLRYNDQAQGVMGSLVATPSLLSRVIKSQGQDTEVVSIRDRVRSSIGDEGWALHTDGRLQYKGRVVVPQLIGLREEILMEFHCSRFAVHPDGTKMYRDLRRQYYWSRDEEIHWGFCSTVSHMSAGKGQALEAYWATPAIGGSGVEVVACHDGLCDSLTTNIA